MSTIDASYASSRDLALLSNVFVPSYRFVNDEFSAQLDTYLQGDVNIGASNTGYSLKINGNPYVQVTLSDWAKAPAIASVDMSGYKLVDIASSRSTDQTGGGAAISFYGDRDTGIYSPSDGVVGILTNNVSGLIISSGGISNRTTTSNSIGNITLSAGSVFLPNGMTLSGFTISGRIINICGALVTASGITNPSNTTNSIAGISLSNGNISNDTNSDNFIGGVRLQGGRITTQIFVGLINDYDQKNYGGGIFFEDGKLMVNVNADGVASGFENLSSLLGVGRFNVSTGDVRNISAGSTEWNSEYSVFGAINASGAALGIGYDTTNGISRIVSAKPGTAAGSGLKNMTLVASTLCLAVTTLNVCGGIFNPSLSSNFIGGVSLCGHFVGGVSISGGGIYTPNFSTINTIGGVTIASQTVSASKIDTGASTLQSVVGGVTFERADINAIGSNNIIGGFLIGNSRIAPPSAGNRRVMFGNLAGTGTSTGVDSIAIGTRAGFSNQGTNSIAIGVSSGVVNQADNVIAIGNQAGVSGQGVTFVAGAVAGFSVAIGGSAGSNSQSGSAIAIGGACGRDFQGFASIAIGNNTGRENQRLRAVAIGDHAGVVNQSGLAVAIGHNAGCNAQGEHSIAIGAYAGCNGQRANSIMLNATGADINNAYQTTSGFYVAPVRSDTTDSVTSFGVLAYNQTTKEIVDVKTGSVTLGSNVTIRSDGTITAPTRSTIGGVTLGSGALSGVTSISASGTISGGTVLATTISAGGPSYVGGVILQNSNTIMNNITVNVITSTTTISAGYASSNVVGGVSLSSAQIVATGANSRIGDVIFNAGALTGITNISASGTFSVNTISAGNATANTIGGVSLSSGQIHASNASNRIGNVIFNGGALTGITTINASDTITAESSVSATSINAGISTIGGVSLSSAQIYASNPRNRIGDVIFNAGALSGITSIRATGTISAARVETNTAKIGVTDFFSSGDVTTTGVITAGVLNATGVSTIGGVVLQEGKISISGIVGDIKFEGNMSNLTGTSNNIGGVTVGPYVGGVLSSTGIVTLSRLAFYGPNRVELNTSNATLNISGNLSNASATTNTIGGVTLNTGITNMSAIVFYGAGGVTLSASGPVLNVSGSVSNASITENYIGGVIMRNSNVFVNSITAGNSVIGGMTLSGAALTTGSGSNSVGGVTLSGGALTTGAGSNFVGGVTLNAGAMSGITSISATGTISAGTVLATTISAGSRSFIGGVTLSGGVLTNVTSISATGTISAGTILATTITAGGSSTIGAVTLNGGNLTNVSTINNSTVGGVQLTNGYIVPVGATGFQISIGSGAYRGGAGSIAIGQFAGSSVENEAGIAIGNFAGGGFQGANSIAIGSDAGGGGSQGVNSIAIGNQAGEQGQSNYSIAIGHRAGYSNQRANSIMLNATGAEINTAYQTTSGFYVAPVRAVPTSDIVIYSGMAYNPTTREIVNASGGNVVIGGVRLAGGSIYGTVVSTTEISGNIGNDEQTSNFIGGVTIGVKVGDQAPYSLESGKITLSSLIFYGTGAVTLSANGSTLSLSGNISNALTSSNTIGGVTLRNSTLLGITSISASGTISAGTVLATTVSGGNSTLGNVAISNSIVSGVNRINIADSQRIWASVASSADGTKLVAGEYTPGRIYFSTNSGVTWTSNAAAGNTSNWAQLASSVDGNTVFAAFGGNDGITIDKLGRFLNGTFSNLGTANGLPATRGSGNPAYFTSVACSANGAVVYTCGGEGVFSKSTNSGSNWTTIGQVLGNWNMNFVECSADGSNVFLNSGTSRGVKVGEAGWYEFTTPAITVVKYSSNGTRLIGYDSSGLYISSNSGSNWSALGAANGLPASATTFNGVASSADGYRLAAITANTLYTSADAGSNWTTVPIVTSGDWRSVASSADGTQLTVVGSNSYIQVINMSAGIQLSNVRTITTLSGFYVAPIRNDTSVDGPFGALAYNSRTNEIVTSSNAYMQIGGVVLQSSNILARNVTATTISAGSSVIGGVILSGGTITAGIITTTISVGSTSYVGGVTLSGGALTNVTSISASGTISAGMVLTTTISAGGRSFVGGVTLSGGALTNVTSISATGTISAGTVLATTISAGGPSYVGGVTLNGGTITTDILNATTRVVIGPLNQVGITSTGVSLVGGAKFDSVVGSSNTIGGVTLENRTITTDGNLVTSNGMMSNFATTSNNIGGVTLNTGITTLSQLVFKGVGGVTLSASGPVLNISGSISNSSIADNYIGGVIIRNSNVFVNSVTAGNSVIGGVTLSGGTITGNFITLTISVGTSPSYVGGVTLSGGALMNVTSISASGTISAGTVLATTISAGGRSFIGGVTLSGGALTNVTSISATGTISAGTVLATTISAGSRSFVGGVTLSGGALTNVTSISATGTISAGTILATTITAGGSSTIGAVTLNSGNLTNVSTINNSTVGGVRLCNGYIVPVGVTQISIGSGAYRGGVGSIAIGQNAGSQLDNEGTIAIGQNAGGASQGTYSIAIGSDAGGNGSQGANSIAIGNRAGYEFQADNSIILGNLERANTNGFFVSQVRSVVDSGYEVLAYNTTTKEIVNVSNAGATVGGVLLCNTNIRTNGAITTGTGNCEVGGVKLGNSNITTNAGGSNSIGGVTLNNGTISNVTTIQAGNGSSSIGGVTLNIGTVTSSNANIGLTGTPCNYRVNIAGTSGTNGFVSFYNSAVGNPYVGIGFDATLDGLSFRTNYGSTDLNRTAIFIKRNSDPPRVGIANTDPQYVLDVSGNGVRIANNNATGVTAGLFLESGLGTGSASLNNYALVSFSTRGGGGGDAVQSLFGIYEGGNYGLSVKNSNVSTGTTVLRMDTTNTRVGVGTISPAYNLDVSGTANVTSNLRVGGSITTVTSISAGKLGLSNLTSESANTNILSINTTTNEVSYTGNYVKGITAGTGITISPAGPGATGVVTITATGGGGTGSVTSVTSANENIGITNPTTTPVVTLNNNLSLTTITTGTGSNSIGGVTLSGGNISIPNSLEFNGTDSVVSFTNTGSWADVASSSDGSKLVACVTSGTIYTSTDSGVNWTPRSTGLPGTTLVWSSVASSSDGSKLVACVNGSSALHGYIYTSIDSGANWTPRQNDSIRSWASVASSSDGSKLLAVNNQYIYLSIDSGANWSLKLIDSFRNWSGVASSSDGSKLIACVNSTTTFGYIYTSIDSGANWTPRLIDAHRNWSGVASSSDGSKMVACVNPGFVYTSVDSGANWTERTTSGSRAWKGVASSSDGSKLVACVNDGFIYTSTDGGATWSARLTDANRSWTGVASSSDGSKLSAVGTGVNYVITTKDRLSNVSTITNGSGKSVYIGGVSMFNGNITNLANSSNYIGGVTLSGGTVLGSTISAGKLGLSNLTSESANTNILSINTTTNEVSYTNKYVKGITAGTGITISPAGPGATGVVTITATGGGGTGSVTSVTSANENITVANGTTTPQLTLNNNLSLTTITAGTGSNYIGGVTLNGGTLTSGSSSGGWVEETNGLPTTANWRSVACSSDGNTLMACYPLGYAYSKTGSTAWIPDSAIVGQVDYTSVACSRDGGTMILGVNGQHVYVKTPTQGWGAQSIGLVSWTSVACSADATTLMACAYGGTIKVKVGTGAWESQTITGASTADWQSVACSGNGNTLMACSINTGRVYVKVGTGAWEPQTLGVVTTANWTSVACSSDGNTLMACSSGATGRVYVKVGTGAWEPQTLGGVTTANWKSVACSSDGNTLMACSSGTTGNVYTKKYTDQWFLSTGIGNADWQSVACSGNGETLIVCSGGSTGEVYVLKLGFVITKTTSSIGGVTLNGGSIIPNFTGGQIAIGSNAGNTGQGLGAVAIGLDAGNVIQPQGAIAIGKNAGNTAGTNSGTYSIAIGQNAGGGGDRSITIGANAGSQGAAANTIVINSTIGDFDNKLYKTQTSSLFVAPIRSTTTTLSALPSLAYNPATNEVVQRGFGQIIAYGSYNDGVSYVLEKGGTLTGTTASRTFTFTTALADSRFVVTFGSGQRGNNYFITGRSANNFTFSNNSNSSSILVDFTVVY